MIKGIQLSDTPQLTTEQMREVDRLMIEEWHVNLFQMMENAGRNLAALAKFMLGDLLIEKRIIVLCGTGNNGGGGMATARHLHNWGAQFVVALTGSPERLKPVPTQQFQSIQKMELVDLDPNLADADLIIDAMIGYGLVGSPRPPISDWISKANASEEDILSLDAPSGLNTTNGVTHGLSIKAKATMTLALPKKGLLTQQSIKYSGELYLADIGVPPELYASPSLNLNVISPFQEGMIVKIIQ